MTTQQTAANPAVATEYVLVSPPALDANDPRSVQDYRTQVTLQMQGDPAVFDAHTPEPALALAFAVAYDAATQVLLRLEDGRIALLFDHEARELLPPEGVDETVWSEILKLRGKVTTAQDVAAPTPEMSIDLAALWSRTREHDDLVARTRLFLKSLAQELAPSATLRLQGDIPALPLLSAVYLSRPTAYAVEYADVSGTVVTLFA